MISLDRITLPRIGDAEPVLFEDDDRLSWLRARQAGLGGSDVAALAGLVPPVARSSSRDYGTPHHVWLSKTVPITESGARQERQPEDNIPAAVGSYMEPFVGWLYARRTGVRVARLPMLRNVERPWMLASPDLGILSDDGDVVGGVEIKRPTIHTADRWGHDTYPLQYLAQCTWYMDVTGLRRWDLVGFVGESRLYIHRIDYDAEFAAMLRDEAERFWRENVTGRVPPPPVDEDERRAQLEALYPESDGTMLEADDDANAVAAKVIECRQAIDAWERRKASMENTLRERVARADGIRGETGGFKWSFTNRTTAGRVKTRALIRHLKVPTEVVNRFRTPGRSPRFNFKENGE